MDENTVYTTPIEETFETWFQDWSWEDGWEGGYIDAQAPIPPGPEELDSELGLPLVKEETIQQKYGVHCDPKLNSFHKSLYDFFLKVGYLTEKQIKALKKQ